MSATGTMEGPQRGIAAAGTIALHALLLLLMLLLKIVPPDPPFKEGGGDGMELGIADLGYSLEGMGENESMEESSPASSSVAAPPEQSDEELLTEENGEAIETPPHKTEKPRTETTVVKPVTKPPKITTPTVNRNALFNPSNNPGNGNGNGQGGDGNSNTPGNVGVPGGDPNGQGVFHGNGWSMRGGRGASRGPDLSEKPVLSNETWVEVAIVIDREGGVKRTYVSDAATSDSNIQNVAVRAVKKMQFVANPTGPPEQVQYVRLTFRPS